MVVNRSIKQEYDTEYIMHALLLF